MITPEPFEIRTSATSGLRWLTGMAIGFTTFMAMVAAGCLIGLLTQDLAFNGSLSAAVIGGVGAWGARAGVRRIVGLRLLAHPEVLARLDADGLHLHVGLGVPDLPEGVGWTTVPWSWITSVTNTTLDLRSVKTLGATDVPLEVLRFVLGDDRLLDGSPFDGPHLGHVARMLGLTPSQVRTVILAEAGTTDHAAALAWLHAHRPGLAVLSGTAPPWSTRLTPDAWPDSPRVAVIGAHGRLGRQVVEVLARREKSAPVALVRNEAHRAVLERLGAEVRMVDLDQGPVAVADALRGCAGVIHLAPYATPVVVEAARRARTDRLLVVSGASAVELDVLASSGLAWTAFRPGLLTDAAPTGEVVLGEDLTPGPVPRADLAEVVVAAVRDEASSGAVWSIAGAPAPQP
jgi:hypothetical protein